MEFDRNYSNIIQCLEDSGGNYEEAQDLYRIRYGTDMAATDVFEKARNYYSSISDTNCYKKISENNSLNRDAESVLIIKKEPRDTEEGTAAIEINPTQHLHATGLESYPLVYTTRLDDMFIFKKNFRRLDVDDVVQSILSESKPKFINKVFDRKTNMKKHQYIINPFFKLVENIRELNEMANTVSFGDFDDTNSFLHINQKFKKLLDKCKTLRVMLVDCKIEKGTTVILNSNFEDDDKNSITITDLKEPRKKLKNPKKQPATVFQAAKLRRSIFNCLIFLNLETRTTDIIYINKSTVPTGIFSVNHILTKDEMPPNSLIMKSCCWLGREEGINGIVGWSKYRHNSDILLKTKHNCPPNMCVCCCKKKLSITQNDVSCSTQVQDNSSFKSDVSSLLTNQLSKEQLEGSISKALRYTRKKSYNVSTIAPIKTTKKAENVLEIDFSNAHTNMVESYYIEQYGRKNKHIEMKAMNSIDFLRFFNNTPFVKIKEVCCWFRRYWLLRESQSLHPHHQTNFIRTPHTCPVDACKCCCRNKISPQKLISLPPASNIPLLKNLSSAKNYMNKTFQRIKQVKKMANKSDETGKEIYVMKSRISNMNIFETFREKAAATTDLIPTKSKKKLSSSSRPAILRSLTPTAHDGTFSKFKIQPNDQQKKIIRPTKPVKAVSSANKKQDTTTLQVSNKQNNNITPGNTTVSKNTTVPGITVAPGNTFLLGNTALPANNTNVLTNSTIPAGGGPLENMDPTVNSMVQSILGRFRDVRLTINADGEVSAELNTPIQNLSTAELKILSAILSHAKEQVKALKSNPGMTDSVMSMFSNTPGASNTPLITSFPNAPLPNNGNFNASAPPPLVFHGTLVSATQVAGSSNIPSYDLSNSNTPPGTPFEADTHNLTFDPVKTGIDPFQCYINLNAMKSEQYELSCKAFIKKRVNSSVPLIKNVYSLIEDPKASKSSQFLGVNKRKITKTYGVAPKRSKPELIPASIPVAIPSTSQQVPTITIIPQRLAPVALPRLQDLIATPFIPPSKPPPLIVNGTLNQTAQFVPLPQELPNVADMPHLEVGPAISIAINNNSDKTDEECILGF